MTSRFYIVDTGYLLALYGVPGSATPAQTDEVVKRFKNAHNAKHDRFVPMAVLHELARHIANVGDKKVARACAQAVLDDIVIAAAAKDGGLFIVDPAPSLDELAKLMQAFVETHVAQGHSLADAAVIELARRKKQERGKFSEVFIWTWETRRGGIRPHSPDAEPTPFPPWSD